MWKQFSLALFYFIFYFSSGIATHIRIFLMLLSGSLVEFGGCGAVFYISAKPATMGDRSSLSPVQAAALLLFHLFLLLRAHKASAGFVHNML